MTLKCVDFFCGGGGMSLGMQWANIPVLAALDNDAHCKKIYEKNHSDTKFLLKDIKQYSPEQMKEDVPEISRNDDDLVFIGCSPCQHWSIITGGADAARKEKSKDSRNLLNEFMQFVDYFNPGFVVVENVRGAYRHRKESGLEELFALLEDKNYQREDKVLSLADYGIPQTRSRYVLLASRIGDISFPKKSKTKKTVRQIIGEGKVRRIKAGETSPKDRLHKASRLSETNIKRLKLTKAGGTRESWIDHGDLMINAYRDKKPSFFRENYGRMFWDKPAPTITTRFYAIGCGRFSHPQQNRALSLREGAMLQTFPNTYDFMTEAFATAARTIGNAVPPKFAQKLGNAIHKTAGNAPTKKGRHL